MDPRLKTRIQTKLRRSTMRCRVFSIKLDRSHISKSNLKHINHLFLEAKWLYNHLIQNISVLETMNSTKLREVPVKTPEGYEDRDLQFISSQMKQSIQERLWTNLKNLSKAKEKGLQVGRIGFTNKINCIPLKQFSVTYQLDIPNKRIRLQGIKSWLRANGLQQITPEMEIANANLVKKGNNFFLRVTTYSDKKSKTISDKVIGIDAGCSTQLTLSNGIKIEYQIPVPLQLRRLDKLVSRKRTKNKNYKQSKRYYKLLARRERVYDRWVRQKSDIQNKVVSQITSEYGVICVQDENVKGWQASGHGKAVSKSCIGGTMTALKNKAATPIVVDRFFASTKTCSECGKKKNMKLSARWYSCTCGHEMDRDVNAAINIKEKGLADRKPLSPLEDNPSDLIGRLEQIPYVKIKYCPVKREAAPL